MEFGVGWMLKQVQHDEDWEGTLKQEKGGPLRGRPSAKIGSSGRTKGLT
jgi:hypothetical protein